MLKLIRRLLGLHEHEYVVTEKPFEFTNRWGDTSSDVMILTTCRTCSFTRRRWKYGFGPEYCET